MDPALPPNRIAQYLYTSHFLSTWNARAFEFGAFLFLARIFPNTLLPASIYALSASAAGATLSPWVGSHIDHGNRMSVVRQSIIGQRSAVAISCILLLLMINPEYPRQYQLSPYVLLGVISCLGIVEKISAMMNMIAIERDWVVIIADDDEDRLRSLSSQMRRIDLFCKLLGPLAIAIADGYSTKIAIVATLAMTALSMPLEYFAIARLYYCINELQAPKLPPLSERCLQSTSISSRIRSFTRRTLRDTNEYIQHEAFLPSFSLSLLYFTVLSFSGPMTTYLLSIGITSGTVGLIRAVSTAFEMSATWLAPFVMGRIGAVRAGIWFLNWQLLCVSVACVFFWADLPLLATAIGTVSAIITSRVGLWGFDLSAQNIVQEEVESHKRGAFSSREFAFQNAFEMLAFISTAVFSRPEQFKFPVALSTCSVAFASVMYAAFVRSRRGHLTHCLRCVLRTEKPLQTRGLTDLGHPDAETIPLNDMENPDENDPSFV